MCENGYRADNWFLPHSSPSYSLLTSSSSFPDPGEPLPSHENAAALLIEHGDCLHKATHSVLLSFQVGLTAALLALTILGLTHHVRQWLKQSRSPVSVYGVIPLSASLISLSLLSLTPSESSLLSPCLTLVSYSCFNLVMLVGSYSRWSMLHAQAILLLSLLFLTVFASLSLVMLAKEYCLSIAQRVSRIDIDDSSSPSLYQRSPRHAYNQPVSSLSPKLSLSSKLLERLYLVLYCFPCVIFSLTFTVNLLSFLSSSTYRRAAFIITSELLAAFSIAIIKMGIAVFLVRFRQSIVVLSLRSITVTDGVASGNEFALHSKYRAHASHVRNLVLMLSLSSLYDWILCAFLLTSSSKYYFMHGLLINLLAALIVMVYSTTLSEPFPALCSSVVDYDGNEDEGDVLQNSSLRSIQEEEENGNDDDDVER